MIDTILTWWPYPLGPVAVLGACYTGWTMGCWWDDLADRLVKTWWTRRVRKGLEPF